MPHLALTRAPSLPPPLPYAPRPFLPPPRLAARGIAHVIAKAIDCASGALVDDGSSDEDDDAAAGVVVDEDYGTTSPLSHVEVAGFQALQAMPPVAQVGARPHVHFTRTQCTQCTLTQTHILARTRAAPPPPPPPPRTHTPSSCVETALRHQRRTQLSLCCPCVARCDYDACLCCILLPRRPFAGCPPPSPVCCPSHSHPCLSCPPCHRWKSCSASTPCPSSCETI